MAESIVLHFKNADWKILRPVLAAEAEEAGDCAADERWLYPDNDNASTILYEYDSVINEYEDSDVDILIDRLGEWPSATLCIELRRSVQKRACDDAERLSLLLLNLFEGIVDDTYSEMWTRQEIEEGVHKKDGKFLDCYRFKSA